MVLFRVLTTIALTVIGLLAAACVGIGGERIPLTHGDLPAVAAAPRTKMSLDHLAHDERLKKVRIGRATFSAFAITSGSVVTEDDLEREVLEEVKWALQQSGYDVELVNPEWVGGGFKGPLLIVSIKSAKFTNYNWFFPIVPTWGGFELGLDLKGANGVTVYRETFEGGGSSFQLIGRSAFTEAAREAMTEILAKMQKVFASEEFRAHWRSVPEVAPATAREPSRSDLPGVSAPAEPIE